MRLAMFAFTRRGCRLAEKVKAILSAQASQCRMFTMEKFDEPNFEAYRPPLAEFVGPVFRWAEALVFIGSTGMTIRAIAPWVQDKKTDPGVVVLDEAGQFVISLLSGHIGGANGLTRQLAAALGAQSVITTATDVNGRFSVDDWAARKGLRLSDMTAAKAVSAGILEGNVGLKSDFPIVTPLPAGVELREYGAVGIQIGCRDTKPFDTTLTLIPRVLHLGIGCRKGIAAEAVEKAVTSVLEAEGIYREAIADAASIDLKAEEPGLLAFCESWKLPVRFYSAEALRQVPGEFPASEFVKSITGVDNVCERAARMGAETIIVHKTALEGVTVALAAENWEVAF